MQAQSKDSTLKKPFGIFVLSLAWFAILFQLYLTESTANFFSYFTILCNLLIAVSLTASLFFPKSTVGVFFSKLSVQTPIALYIFIVSVVYNLVLRGILILSGWNLVLDNMLHVIIPILYIIFWIFFRTKGSLKWQDGIYWIVFPFLYLVYSLIRGSIVNWYPYPFLNAAKFGYAKVFENIAIMLIVFLVSGLVLISITRFIENKTKVNAQL